MKSATRATGEVDAWLAECSLDPRVDWITWRSRMRVRAWRAGVRVPERSCRTRGTESFAHWSDATGRYELLVGTAERHTLAPRELARWGGFAVSVGQPAEDPAAAPSTDPEFVLHDLAHLLAHAELELHASADGRARAREALRGARELLDAVRTGRHRGARAATVLDLRTTLEREAQRAAASVPDCGVALRVRVAPAAECSLHAPTFERIARNLVVNALQASPRGATVSVEVETAGEFVELVVCDEGRGLDERAATRLFTAGADRPRGRGRGRGLGARSVRACVEALAGELSVRSQPARGTEVRVRLPKHASRADERIFDPLPRRRLERRQALETCARIGVASERTGRDGEPTPNRQLVLARGSPVSGLGDVLADVRARGDSVRVLGWSERVSATS